MKNKKEDILSDIERIPSEVDKEIMRSVVEYAFKYKHVTEFGIGDVKGLVSNKFSEIDILLSLQKLCLLKYPLLELKYEYQESEDEYYELPILQVEKAKETGYLIHPMTGKAIEKEIFQTKVFMFFKITRL